MGFEAVWKQKGCVQKFVAVTGTLDDWFGVSCNAQVHMEARVMDKFKALFSKRPYSMYENKIVRDYRDGKVTKEGLDKCRTCDMCATVNNGLSVASMEQLKNKTGEEIVDADIAAQLKISEDC